MNKDVIYIEPEDDITDIITKIENSKEKIVALVPPKKATVFRSSVNIKLIHKAGFTTDKTIVLVTTDPSIMRLAATVKMPVTKNLQSAPSVPDVFSEPETVVETVETDEDGKEVAEAKESEIKEEIAVAKEASAEVKAEATTQEGSKSEEKPAKPEKMRNAADGKFVAWVKDHKKVMIASCVGAVVLIFVMIWAFAIAPAVTVTVGIRTSTGNFSENVTFTDKLADEDASSGKFYLEEKKIESKTEVEFEATGEKNVGTKASGEVIVYAYFRGNESVAINAGSTFSLGELSFVSAKDATLSWDGKTSASCDNNGQASAITSGCLISGRIAVTATQPGDKYNIAATSTGWKTTADVGVYTDKAMTGGTNKIVTVVTQADVDAAVAEIKISNESANKELLLDMVGDDEFAIESSFKQTVGDPVSTPAVGEEIKGDEKPKVTVAVTDTIYVIDETKVKEFITEKAKLADNYKIYEMNDPFIENFTSTDNGYVGKLKTSYVSGPRVTENDITDIVKGKGLGEASKAITSTFDGISEVHIDPSFPWVYSVPNDTNKITVVINVKN